jgi:isopropylmalate/homocitrate/citramalate synthase
MRRTLQTKERLTEMKEVPWITDDYIVAEANFADEALPQWNPRAEIELHDLTMRDGEGTPGVVFQKEEKIELAKRLDEVGLHRIEVGHAEPPDYAAMEAIGSLDLNASIWAWCGNPEEVEVAAKFKMDGVMAGVASGAPALKASGVSKEETRRRAIDTVKCGKDNGLRVTYFPWDTTRAELSFLKDLVAEVAEKGSPDSVAIVDTRGITSPHGMAYLVKVLTEASGGLPIEIHAHNDFGLGVANALAGIAVGAAAVHVSVMGLGERTGNCPLEPLVMALKLLYGIDLGIKTELFFELAQLVAGYAKLPISPRQQVVGKYQFVRVTGGGVPTLKDTPTVIFPYNPQLVGRHWEVWLGKVSSAASVGFKIQQLGLDVSDDQAAELLELAKAKAIAEKRYILDDEFCDLVEQVRGK